MTAVPGAAAAGAAAAAEQQRRLHEEEEELTDYTPDDLDGGWEFKILRANTNVFRKPETLRTVCEEEAQFGWELLEKFDDKRLRFRRPVSARQLDSSGPTDADPYRTQYGISDGNLVLIGLLASFGVVAVLALLIALFTNGF